MNKQNIRVHPTKTGFKLLTFLAQSTRESWSQTILKIKQCLHEQKQEQENDDDDEEQVDEEIQYQDLEEQEQA